MEEKGGLLDSFESCEYASTCNQECCGKRNTRNTTFSCALRRGLLINDGYQVKYGYTNKEARIKNKYQF